MATSPRLRRSNYRLLGLVGHGQFGRVYCAVHRQTGQLAALKDLNRNRLTTHKFLRELRFLLSLAHPNIAACYALEHTETGRQLVLDYCEGGTLRHLMDYNHVLTVGECLELIVDTLEGLQHAHKQGIVHCDIKPENILLCLKPNGWVAKISDFGVARLSQDMADSGNTGSPAYMAPERFYHQYSAASDLYAVGIMLFEILLGYRPFSGTPVELMAAHLNKALSIPNTMPPKLGSLIQKALQKLPQKRFRSAGEMVSAIRLIQAESPDWLADHPICPDQVAGLVITPPAQLQPQTTEVNSHPIEVLAIPPSITDEGSVAQYLCIGSQTELSIRRYSEGLFATDTASTGEVIQSMALPYPIQAVQTLAQGCWILTQRSVHWLRDPWLKSCCAQDDAIPIGVTSSIAKFNRDIFGAVSPQGTWFVAAAFDYTENRGWVHIGRIPRLGDPRLGAHFNGTIPRLVQSLQPLKLLVLEQRHWLLVSHEIKQPRTLLEIFTRRGTRVGRLRFDVPLKTIISTPILYRLAAIEAEPAQAILFIDIKPFRIFRYRLDITPSLITALPWGCVVVSTSGQIRLIDWDGHIVGQFVGPTSPTALASFEQHGLLMATQSSSEHPTGTLHHINLRTVDLDLLF